jgi:hypothetical protein
MSKTEQIKRLREIRQAALDAIYVIQNQTSPDPLLDPTDYIVECLNDIDGISAQVREEVEA